MRISTMVNTLPQARDESAQLERLGYDALFTNESKHDPFVLAALIAEHTARVELMTYIAVAFARTPMVVAQAAGDVNALARGRFTLGLGSQIKPHITRRFSMPWSHPAPRMKEFIRALHAIWDCWYEGKPLDFRGEFYTHTLTSPMFIREDKSYGRPKVMLGAVGPAMTQVAAEVADGLLCHSFTTSGYLHEVTLPKPWARLRQSSIGPSRRRGATWLSTPPRPRTARCWTSTAGASCSRKCCACRSSGSGRRWGSGSPIACSRHSW